MDNKVSISIIIVNYNLTESIRKLLESIKKFVNEISYEVIVVDNNSPDRSIENLKVEFPEFNFQLLNTNLGFGHGNNSGVKLSKGEYLLLLNPDTYLTNNLPLQLFSFAEKHPEFGSVGPRLIFPDGNYQVSYARFPNIKQELLNAIGLIGFALTLLYKLKDFFFRRKEFYIVDFLFGSCMFIRRDIFQKVNGFDEDYFLFSEEVDLCYKIKNAGFKNIYWKNGSIVHEKSLITGKNMPERIKLGYESRLKFFKKHYSKFRLFFLRYTIIGTFLFKHLTLFRKEAAKQKYKKAYQSIIRLYIQS